MQLSDDAQTTAGILLLAVLFVQYGGIFVLRTVRGNVPTTDFQRAFFRAGHAHAGVLVVLSLVVQIFADSVDVDGALAWVTRSSIPVAAILMPAGFFLSASGSEAVAPNRLILLLYVGAVFLAAGAASLGIALLVA